MGKKIPVPWTLWVCKLFNLMQERMLDGSRDIYVDKFVYHDFVS